MGLIALDRIVPEDNVDRFSVLIRYEQCLHRRAVIQHARRQLGRADFKERDILAPRRFSKASFLNLYRHMYAPSEVLLPGL